MSQSAWYREIGDNYARYAEQTRNPLAKTANANEAAKYYGMAERIDARLAAPVETQEKGDQ